MKYNGPFDQPGNPDAAYIDGDSRSGIPGSIPPAEAFEYPQRELVNFFDDNGLTPSNDDLDQLSRSFQNMAVIYGVDTGTTNNLSVVLDPAPTSRVVGMTIRVRKANSDNTGALTLNIGLGADPVVKMNGAAFAAGDFPANGVLTATWDGSRWMAKNYLGKQSATQTTTNNYTVNIPYCVDTSNTANTIVAPFSPTITSVAAGDVIMVKLNKAFTGGAATITVNSLAPVWVKRGDGTDPLFGDGYVGQIVMFEFDGAAWQIVNSSTPAKPLPIVLTDEKPAGTPGGTSVGTPADTPAAWHTRDLNTIHADPFGLSAGGLVNISSNRFSLAAGKWIAKIRCPMAGAVGGHQHRLMNVTDNTQVLKSTHYSGAFLAGGGITEFDFMEGLIDIAAMKTFEVQVVCAFTINGYGYGHASSQSKPWANSGVETYTVIELLKVS